MAANKNDIAAREHWGSEVYDSIPKSVFAAVAWHLANIGSAEPDTSGAAETRFVEELRALCNCGLIPEQQAKAALRALAKAEGQS